MRIYFWQNIVEVFIRIYVVGFAGAQQRIDDSGGFSSAFAT
jgi:hypothetical protein